MKEIPIIPGYLAIGVGQCIDPADIMGGYVTGIVTEADDTGVAIAFVVANYGFAIGVDRAGNM